MKFDKAKVLCLVAFAFAVSSCGSSDGNSNEAGSESPGTTVLPTLDDVVDTGDPASTELTTGTDTSAGFATPVIAVSSSEMDDFVINPLQSAIPAELSGGSTSTQPARFITNPLMF